MKKILAASLFALLLLSSNAQSIRKWKINELANRYSKQTDTVFVVHFWSTLCKPCVEEIPYLQTICKKYSTKNVKLLLISLDMYKMYPEKLSAFAKAHGFTAELGWLDETDADVFCPVVDKSWSGAIPATIMINGKTGYKSFHEMKFTPRQFEKELIKAIGNPASTGAMPVQNHLITFPSPLKNGMLFDYAAFMKKTMNLNISVDPMITYVSRDSSVSSLSAGVVSLVTTLDDTIPSTIVIVISPDSNFYTYSNLQTTAFKKGNLIHEGQFIGYAQYNPDVGQYQADFIYYSKEAALKMRKK